MKKKKNIFIKLIHAYVYSSYTFHLSAIGLSYLAYIISIKMHISAPYPLMAMFIMSLLSAAVVGTLTQINYKEIKENLNHKIISILTYKNKISEGERMINTLVSSTINIVILNIINYALILNDNIKPLPFVLLLFYILLVFAQINALHRAAKKIRNNKH